MKIRFSNVNDVHYDYDVCCMTEFKEAARDAAENHNAADFEFSYFNVFDKEPKWVTVLRSEICTRTFITPRFILADLEGSWVYLVDTANLLRRIGGGSDDASADIKALRDADFAIIQQRDPAAR